MKTMDRCPVASLALVALLFASGCPGEAASPSPAGPATAPGTEAAGGPDGLGARTGTGTVPSSAPAADPAGSAADVGTGPAAADAAGRVIGRIRYGGEPPRLEPLGAGGGGCPPALVPDESLLVDAESRGIANAVVMLEGVARPGTWPAGSETAVHDQRRCVFTEHVRVVRKGARVRFTNSDPEIHNISGESARTRFNQAIPGKGEVTLDVFGHAGPIRVSCSIHTWMSSWLYVADHPYTLKTDAQGRFTIDAVPPGEYRLVVWHETLGKHAPRGEAVTVTAGAATEVELTYRAR